MHFILPAIRYILYTYILYTLYFRRILILRLSHMFLLRKFTIRVVQLFCQNFEISRNIGCIGVNFQCWIEPVNKSSVSLKAVVYLQPIPHFNALRSKTTRQAVSEIQFVTIESPSVIEPTSKTILIPFVEW